MPKLRAPQPMCARAAALARAIEGELHALGLWEEEPPPPAAACTFAERIEFELLPLLQALAVGGIDMPEQTSVGTRGVVEFGHRPGAEELEALLFEVDRLIRGYRFEVAALGARRARGDPERARTGGAGAAGADLGLSANPRPLSNV
jgi:hypothetical protein